MILFWRNLIFLLTLKDTQNDDCEGLLKKKKKRRERKMIRLGVILSYIMKVDSR